MSVPTLALLVIMAAGLLYYSVWARYLTLGTAALLGYYVYKRWRTIPPGHCAVVYNTNKDRYWTYSTDSMVLMPSETLVQARWPNPDHLGHFVSVDYLPTKQCNYVMPEITLVPAELPLPIAVQFSVDFQVRDASDLVRGGETAFLVLQDIVRTYFLDRPPQFNTKPSLLDPHVVSLISDHLNHVCSRFVVEAMIDATPGGTTIALVHGLRIISLHLLSIRWPKHYTERLMEEGARAHAVERRTQALQADSDRQRALLNSGLSAQEVQQLDLAAAARNTALFGRPVDFTAVAPLAKPAMPPPSTTFVPRTATRASTRRSAQNWDDGTM